MPYSPRRRSLLLAALASPLAGIAFPVHAHSTLSQQVAALRQLETAAGGRLGLSALDTASGLRLQYRGGERFPVCSTFKVIVAAAILQQSTSVHDLLQKRIRYDARELDKSGYAPITEKHIQQGMTVAELCAATLQYSDNAAVNLLMQELGGPAAITAYARAIGDDTFRLDRWEPELNSAIPGDPRDTSTPVAMESTLQKLTLGNALAAPQRTQLVNWLKGNTTGSKRMLAGVPAGWIVGDKTGTGSYGTTNDIGLLWSPDGQPIVATIYYTQHEKDARARDEVIASATRIVVDAFSQQSGKKM